MHLLCCPSPHNISHPIRDWIAALWTSSDLSSGSNQDECQGQHSQNGTETHDRNDVVGHHWHHRSRAAHCNRDAHTVKYKKKNNCRCYRWSHKVVGCSLQKRRKQLHRKLFTGSVGVKVFASGCHLHSPIFPLKRLGSSLSCLKALPVFASQ